MGSLVKLGPGCRQNTEPRTQNSEPPPWTPEYSSPPLPSSSCASSTPAPASNVTSATHTTTSTAATPSTSRTHPMSRRHKSSWPSAPQMAKNTSAGKSTRTCAVTRGSSGAVVRGGPQGPRLLHHRAGGVQHRGLRLPRGRLQLSWHVPRLRCRVDCCGSGLPASLDHAAISTQTVPRPTQLQQLQQQLQLQLQLLLC